MDWDSYEKRLKERVQQMERDQPYFHEIDDQIDQFQKQTGLKMVRADRDDVLRNFYYSVNHQEIYELAIIPGCFLIPSENEKIFGVRVKPLKEGIAPLKKWTCTKQNLNEVLREAMLYMVKGAVHV